MTCGPIAVLKFRNRWRANFVRSDNALPAEISRMSLSRLPLMPRSRLLTILLALPAVAFAQAPQPLVSHVREPYVVMQQSPRVLVRVVLCVS